MTTAQTTDLLKLIERKEDYLLNRAAADSKAAGAVAAEIKILRNVLNAWNQDQDTAAEIIQDKEKAILKLKEHILALESICFIHGINDIPAWLSKGARVLYAYALDFCKSNTVQIPNQLKPLIKL